MVGSPTTTEFLVKYADSFSIPREISTPILKTFQKWRKSNGDEWSVNRVKSIKLDFIRMKAGLEPVSLWIKSGRYSKFGGHFGALERWSKKNHKNWSKSILFVQFYTSLYSPKVTDQQEKKFLDGVNATPITLSYGDLQLLRKAVNASGIERKFCRNTKPLLTRPVSDTKREPHADGRTFPEGTYTIECAGSFYYQTEIGTMLRHKYKSLFDPVLNGFTFSTSWHEPLPGRTFEDRFDYPDSVGKIGLIQEAGYKLRAVANPARVYQQALKPLGDSIYDILKVLPWDCTHNQNLPISTIQRHLSEGKVAHCVDLSGATDNFPLNAQIAVLNQIFPNSESVDLFVELSRAPWRYKDTFISWKKGQPLGLYPSFGSFALTHGLLLFALNNYSHNNDFFVLGDDVIILNDQLNSRYRDMLKKWECPVSENKSISSNVIGEFAGRLISPTSSLSQLKWRNPSDDSFLDVVRNIGPKAISLLKSRQRKVALQLFEVPDFMGGLGFNPKGLPLEVRVEQALHLFDKVKNTSYLMSFNGLISRSFNYDASIFPSSNHVSGFKLDLDQRSIGLVQEFVPCLTAWYEIAGCNLYSINDDLSLSIDGKPSRVSTLERYESLLR
jgi:hypothetical protein